MRISDWSSGVCSSDLHPRRPPGGSTSASPRGWRLRRSPGCWSWVRDRPGHDRGEPKDTPMKLHRHARPDAGVSSSAAPIANSDTRERSEEHTSELQSLMRISYAVFCLKKKKPQYINLP